MAQISQLQRGRVARRQLRAAGIPTTTIDRLVAKGQLIRERRTVYAVGHAEHGPLTRETSTLLACCEGAILSHRTAAALWKLIPPPPESHPIEVTIAGRATANPAGVRVHRTRRLHDSEVRTNAGLPITSPARTLLDISECQTERQTERSLDEGLERNLYRKSHIKDVIARNPGRRGTTILRRLLAKRTGSTVSRSGGEEHALWLIRQANLPEPEMNYPMHGYIADFYWPQYRLVLEVDGYRYHSTKTAFERDRRKDTVFRAAGLDVVRQSTDQIFDESFAFVAVLATAIARADARRAA